MLVRGRRLYPAGMRKTKLEHPKKSKKRKTEIIIDLVGGESFTMLVPYMTLEERAELHDHLTELYSDFISAVGTGEP